MSPAERIAALRAELGEYDNIPPDLLRSLEVLDINTQCLVLQGFRLRIVSEAADFVRAVLADDDCDLRAETAVAVAVRDMQLAPIDADLVRLEAARTLINHPLFAVSFDAQELGKDVASALSLFAAAHPTDVVVQAWSAACERAKGGSVPGEGTLPGTDPK